MKICFKAILVIITHTVGRICDSSQQKFNWAKLDGNLQLILPIAAKVDAVVDCSGSNVDCWTNFTTFRRSG